MGLKLGARLRTIRKGVDVGRFMFADAEHDEHVGAEHLLLALIEHPKRPGARALAQLGADRASVAAAWRVDDG